MRDTLKVVWWCFRLSSLRRRHARQRAAVDPDARQTVVAVTVYPDGAVPYDDGANTPAPGVAKCEAVLVLGPASSRPALYASLCLLFWGVEFRGIPPREPPVLPLNGTQVTTNGRQKGQHVIIFHCQVEICIAVSCRFTLVLLSFLPPVRALCCAGACLTRPH